MDVESGTTVGDGFATDSSAVFGDDLLGEGKAEASTAGFGAVEGFEEVCPGGEVDAFAGIGDFEVDDTGFVARGKGESAAGGHSFDGVADEIEDGLPELGFVAVDDREDWV